MLYESPNHFNNDYTRIDNPGEMDLSAIKQGDYFILDGDDFSYRVDGFIKDKELVYNIDKRFISFNKIKTLFILNGARFY